jgi:hypothetical protein
MVFSSFEHHYQDLSKWFIFFSFTCSQLLIKSLPNLDMNEFVRTAVWYT